MSDFIPKSNAGSVKGLGPKAQKLAALKAKAAAKSGDKNFSTASGGNAKAASAGFKKTSFQRKAT